MKHIFIGCCALVALMLLTGFTSEQSMGSQARRQKTNLSGTLVTHNGVEYSVQNISVGNTISGVPFFELPEQKKNSSRMLSEDPHAGAVFEINLEKGLVIEATPGNIWSYKRNEKASKVEYVEIVITPCDKGEKKRYIVETTRHLFCEEVGACDPISMKIPLSQVKKLTIEESGPWQEGRQCPIQKKKQPNIENQVDQQ